MAVFEKVNTCARLMISCDVHLFILFLLVICFFSADVPIIYQIKEEIAE